MSGFSNKPKPVTQKVEPVENTKQILKRGEKLLPPTPLEQDPQQSDSSAARKT